MGFFAPDQLVSKKQPLTLVPKCDSCGLYRNCESPKIPIAGKGNRRILIVGEAPGSQEDYQNIPFVGPAGQKLRSTLGELGIDPDEDCWITNAVICRTWRKDYLGNKSNRNPTLKEIEYCRPNLIHAIKLLKPSVIILLGAKAVDSLIGWLWRDNPGKIGKWRGWRIPYQGFNCWICPAWHPSYLLYASGKNMEEDGWDQSEAEGEGESKGDNEVREMIWESDLAKAIRLESHPWKEVPDWKKQVRVVMNSTEAVDCIRGFLGEQPVAWDIETEGLKPDSKDLEIYSCSMSNGETTISFPWTNAISNAMISFLIGNTPKIGWNLKYEDRWIRAKLGIEVNNWIWDGMLTTHCFDNRAAICSLKFQAFVQLGISPWDDHIKPFLEAEGSNSKNRIKEIRLNELLIYGGLDALLEYKMWQLQTRKMK